MSAPKVSFSLLAGLVVVAAVGVVGSLGEPAASNNNSSSNPVVSTSGTNSSGGDSGNSESRVTQKIITEIPLAARGDLVDKKAQVVSSSGYQLEVLADDDTSEEEGKERADRSSPTPKGSEHQLSIYPTSGGLGLGHTPSLVDQFLHTEYDENSAKEDRDDYIPSPKLAHYDIKPTQDIAKVRDLFVQKEMSGNKGHHLPEVQSTNSYATIPAHHHHHDSKYKLDYESPVKYGSSTPILLKPSALPLGESSSPHGRHDSHDHHHHDHHDFDGHTAGYGHGFHHHQQKLKAKPLKPSVVYRDPHDRFDHHDKIRTLDKDHLGHDKDSHQHHHHHHYEPHVTKGHEQHHGWGHEKKGGYHHEQPAYYYDQKKVPECAHKNKYIYNLTFCLDDPHYPTDTIMWALKEHGLHAKKLLSDVTYQSADNLVTGLTRAEEEGYTYKHYFGATHAQNDHLDKYKPPYHGYTYSTDYFKKGGYICPSDIYYARPKRAMNTFGKWKVIVNVDHLHDHHGHEHHGHGGYDKPGHGHHGEEHSFGHHHAPHEHDHGLTYSPEHGVVGGGYDHSIKKREYKEYKKSYTQTLRLEQCIYPNAPCSYVDSRFHSSCIQKHNFVRLVAWTHEEGLHVDTFKMPIACSCHVRQPIHFYHESGHHGHEHGHIVPPVESYNHGHGHDHHGHGHIHHSPSENKGVIKKIY